MQTNPEQWAVELANEVAVAVIANQSGSITPAAALIQAAFAEREARLVPQWVFPKSIGDMPKKPGEAAYEYVECLVIHKGDMLARPWNCEHQVFDDEAQDDHFCEWHEVTAYIDLTEARATLASLKDRTNG